MTDLEVYIGLLCNMQIFVICIVKINHFLRLQTTHMKLHVHVKCFEFKFFFILRLYLRIYLCGARHLVKIVPLEEKFTEMLNGSSKKKLKLFSLFRLYPLIHPLNASLLGCRFFFGYTPHRWQQMSLCKTCLHK